MPDEALIFLQNFKLFTWLGLEWETNTWDRSKEQHGYHFASQLWDFWKVWCWIGLSRWLIEENPPAKARDAENAGLIPWLRRFPERKWNLLQDFCSGNLMDRGTCELQSMVLQRVGQSLVTEHNTWCWVKVLFIK